MLRAASPVSVDFKWKGSQRDRSYLKKSPYKYGKTILGGYPDFVLPPFLQLEAKKLKNYEKQ